MPVCISLGGSRHSETQWPVSCTLAAAEGLIQNRLRCGYWPNGAKHMGRWLVRYSVEIFAKASQFRTFSHVFLLWSHRSVSSFNLGGPWVDYHWQGASYSSPTPCRWLYGTCVLNRWRLKPQLHRQNIFMLQASFAMFGQVVPIGFWAYTIFFYRVAPTCR